MTDALPLSFIFTCAAAPVQAEGTLAGRAFYFRARGEAWELTVAKRPGTIRRSSASRTLRRERRGIVQGRCREVRLPRAISRSTRRGR